ENHLLTIGRDATLDGRVQDLKLTIFDVSNFAAPRETFTYILEGADYSEAAYEHKAFNWFPERKQLAIPLARYSWGSDWSAFESKLAVFSVDNEVGFTPIGTLQISDL